MRFDWTVTIGGVDVSHLVKAAGTIDYGLRTPQSGFSAPTAVFDMFTKEGWPQYGGTWPTIALNQAVVIHVTWDGSTQWRRFTGQVQGIDQDRFNRRITAAGYAGKLDYHWSGSTSAYAPRGSETDIDRVAWLASGSTPTVTLEGAAGRWLRAVPDNQPTQPLLDQLLRIADDCDAYLLEDRLGVVHYRTRYFTPPAQVLIPEAITEATQLTLNTELGQIRNSVDVYFGEADTTSGLQPHAHDDRPTSVTANGRRHDTLNTDLQWQAGAYGKAVQYLDKRVQQWTVPDVTLLMCHPAATGPIADLVLDLQLGWPVKVATLPPGAPFSEYPGQIIGTTDIMHETDYRVILHLAPYVAPVAEPVEDPIYPDGVITGWTSQGLITGTGPDVGKQWRWCTWSTVGSGSITNTHTDQVYADTLAVAGGGGGGSGAGSQGAGGGGGAGGLLAVHQFIGRGAQPITIGAGGAAGANGQDSYILGTTLNGGGAGASTASGSGPHSNGSDGGSGGGCSFNRATNTTTAVGGHGVDGLGWDGGFGGGGAAGVGQSGSGHAGGPGVTSSIDGTARTYAEGGAGTGGVGGLGAAGAANSGTGGTGGYQGFGPFGGGSGVFIAKYRIA